MLWLDPKPADAFRALTTVVTNACPVYQPDGGEHDDVIPHLTVGDGVPEARLREAEAKVLPHLLIPADISAAALWCGTDAPVSWHPVTALPIG